MRIKVLTDEVMRMTNGQSSPSHIKVLLTVENDDGTCEIESVWAIPEEGFYRLDNIPFFARGFAWGDLVGATPDPDGGLRCTGLVSASGHSTIRLAFDNADDVQKVRDELRAMRCESELNVSRLVAVNVPPDVPYSQVRDYFDKNEKAGVFEYEEGCLGQPGL